MTSLNRNLYWVWGLWAGLGPVFQSMGFGSSWVSCSGCEVSELSGGLKRGCEVSEFCLPFYPLVSSLEKLMDLYCQLWSLWALWGSVVRISDVWVVKYKVSEVFGSLSLGVLLWTILGSVSDVRSLELYIDLFPKVRILWTGLVFRLWNL